MAGNFVDSLVIGIGLDTSQIAQGVKEVGAQLDSGLSAAAQSAASKMSPLGEALKNLGKQAKDAKEQVQEIPPALDDAASRVKGVFSGIWGQIIGPLAGAFALGGSISNYIANSIGAGELAEKLKVDVEEIQIWSGAMERAGGSASGLQSTIEKLNASGKAQGDAIGVLLDLADKAETMSKDAFYAKAKELEIDEKTIEVLAQGRKALDEHLRRQKELGAYTKEDAENSKRFKQSLADLLQVWDSFTSFIGRLAVPAMKWLADVLTDVVVFLRQHTPFVVAAIGLVGAVLAAKLMPPLKELPKLVSGVSKAFLRWMPFVAVIAGIALLIDDFYAYLTGGKSALEDVWAIFGTGPEIMAKLAAAWEVLKGGIRTAWEGIKQFIAYMGNLAKASGWLDGLKNALKGVAQIFKGLFSGNAADIGKGFGRLFRGLGQMVLGSLRSLGTMIKDMVKGWFSFDGEGITLSGVVSAIWKAITTAFTNIGKFIASFWEGAFDIELPSLDELGKKIWNTIKNVIDDLKKMIPDAFKNLFKDIKFPSVKDLLGGAGDIAGGAVDLVKGGLGKAGDFFGDLFKGAGPETAKAGAQVEDGMARTAGNVEGGFMSTWTKASSAAVSLFGGAAKDIRAMFSGIFAELQSQAQSMVAGARAMVAGGGAMVPAYAGVRAQQAGGRGPTINQQNRVNVYAPGGDPATVQRGVERGLNPGRTARAAASGTVQK